nr:MAG TPA: ribonucleotide-diphosphate reductase subunit alpha [Caudoviricetes sp.]
MISLDCHHPDLLDFIDIKAKPDSVTKANISVRVTDDFMQAVEEDTDWVMSFTREETGETITKTAKARDIFNKLCENNWNWAEPGILFWDRIEKYNLLENNSKFKYAGTNPCVTGDTLIHTTQGVFPIKELVGQQPHVYCMDEEGNIAIRTASKVWLTRKDAQLVRVVTCRGELRCTPDHLIHTRNRGWVCVSDLKRGDKITGMNRQMKGEIHVSVGLSGGKYIPEHRLIAGFYADIDGKDVHHKDGDTFHNVIDNLEILDHGAHSVITNTGRHIEAMRDEAGRYVTKPVKAKRRSINQGIGVGTNWTVVGVEWLDEHEDVYDMTVPGVHNFIANRMVVHNCAEEPLPAGGSCLLGSINLAEFVNNEKFDYQSLINTVSTAVRTLNDVLDEGLPLHPLKEQRESVRDWRQIGLGIMGLADMLIKMKLRYDSTEAIEFCQHIAYLIANQAICTSAFLAKEHGHPYPLYTPDTINTEFFKNNTSEETLALVKEYGLYNSQLLTIAPTGTLSTMLGISGGIEPIFAKSYKRKTESLHNETVYYDVLTPIYQNYADTHGLGVNDKFPEWFVDSSEIDWSKRVKMQATWQKSIDASISSTVNLPKSATVDDVANIYMEAWRHGLKGITVYRSGCMREGVLVVNDNQDNAISNPNNNDLPRGAIIDCTDDLIGKKRKLQTGCGSLHVLAFFDPVDGSLQEVYFNKGSTGGCANFMTGLSRTVSLLCRAGVDIATIKDQLDSTGVCPSYATRRVTHHDTSPGSCCPMAIGNALMDMWKEMQDDINDDEEEIEPTEFKEKENTIYVETPVTKCPECGSELVREGGCIQCKSCGWSKCE